MTTKISKEKSYAIHIWGESESNWSGAKPDSIEPLLLSTTTKNTGGERWKIIPNEVVQYIRGFYGRPPAPIDKTIQEKAIGAEKPITVRPADLLTFCIDEARQKVSQYSDKDEDVISYCIFPEITMKWLIERSKPDQMKQKPEVISSIPESLDSTTLAIISGVIAQQDQQPISIATSKKPIRVNIWGIAGRQELHRDSQDIR